MTEVYSENNVLDTNWHYAWSKPRVKADLKTTPQDFYVEEELGFEPEGKGEHLYLFIEKQGMNTEYLAKLLAQHAGITPNKVTYSGVKDRYAVTRQWFCLHVLNDTPDFSNFPSAIGDKLHELEMVRIIQQVRHPRKLKIGIHKKNTFIIRLRRLEGSIDDLKDRLSLIALEGVPNYFGPQRFGIAGNNLIQGANWLKTNPANKGRLSKTESFWLSAIRSWFFNKALSTQIEHHVWNNVYINDRVQLQATSSELKLDNIDASILKRLHQLELHPLMPLANATALQDTSQVRSHIMAEAWHGKEDLLAGLLSFGLAREDRLTRLYPENMNWEIKDAQLILQFSLPKGSYATSVLRELLDFNDCSGVEAYENIDSK